VSKDVVQSLLDFASTWSTKLEKREKKKEKKREIKKIVKAREKLEKHI